MLHCLQGMSPFLVPASAMNAAAANGSPNNLNLRLNLGQQQPLPGLEAPRTQPSLADSLTMRGKAACSMLPVLLHSATSFYLSFRQGASLQHSAQLAELALPHAVCKL